MRTKKAKTLLGLVMVLIITLLISASCSNPIASETYGGTASAATAAVVAEGMANDSSGKIEEGVPDNDKVAALIEKLAERFGLDQDEVVEFFKEIRLEKRADVNQKFMARLDEMVSKGTLTSAQREAIIEKTGELKIFNKELENMKVSEARQAIKEKRKELKEWAEDNEIDLKHLFPFASTKFKEKIRDRFANFNLL